MKYCKHRGRESVCWEWLCPVLLGCHPLQIDIFLSFSPWDFFLFGEQLLPPGHDSWCGKGKDPCCCQNCRDSHHEPHLSTSLCFRVQLNQQEQCNSDVGGLLEASNVGCLPKISLFTWYMVTESLQVFPRDHLSPCPRMGFR